MRTPEQRRLAAIMFTDMVGYSALTQRDEALAIELLEEQRRLLRNLFVQFNGAEIDCAGDGFLVEFSSALEAARGALAIQKTLAQRNAGVPPDRVIQLRIGIHAGDVIHREDRVLGDAVNIAARIEPLAPPGGCAITRAVRDQIHGKLDCSVSLPSTVPLKNISHPVEVFFIEMVKRDDAAFPSERPAGRFQSIAVLPFVNMSPDRENEFFTDGITEDLIAALSKIKGLRVPARTTAFTFKGKNEDIRRIGRLLQVSHVLEGSVRKSGNRLRVTAQLVEVEDGFHLWSERYDRELKDVFDIQDEITKSIVAALRIELADDPKGRLVRPPTESTEAYQLYLKGREQWNQRGRGLQKALLYFELALLEDPNYALALTGLADTQSLLAIYCMAPAREALAKAKAAAERAVALDDGSAEAHTSLAFAKLTYDLNPASAEGEFLKAIEKNPNYAPAYYWFGAALQALGRIEESLARTAQALELDPLSPVTHAQMSWRFLVVGRGGEAVRCAQRALELNERFLMGDFLYGWSLCMAGRSREGTAALERVVEKSARNLLILAVLGGAYARAGEKDKAERILAEIHWPSRWGLAPKFYVASIYAALGDLDKALACLEAAWQERELWLMWLEISPDHKVLHSTARFQELVAKLKSGGPELAA